MKTSQHLLSDIQWIEVVSPTKEGLLKLAQDFNLPMRPLLDCLDPEVLPKYEVIDDLTIVMMRVMLSDSPKSTSLDKMTTKIGLFITPKMILTIHRIDLPFMSTLNMTPPETLRELDSKELFKRITSGVLASYDPTLAALEKRIDSFESSIFGEAKTTPLIKQGYQLRRRLSTLRKVIKMTLDVLAKISARQDLRWTDFQDLKEEAENNLFYADDDLENLNSLLNLHVALASQKTNEASYKTNEIMRLLTVFSIFFLPLNFIAGLYGMNFKNMPELEWQWGYFTVIALMALVASSLFYWMWSRGWLARPEKFDDSLKLSDRARS